MRLRTVFEAKIRVSPVRIERRRVRIREACVATARLNQHSIPRTRCRIGRRPVSRDLLGTMGVATKTRLTFQSGGESLVGNLYLPEGDTPAGLVVAVGPLTSVKEQAAGTYAQAMAERGYAALAFD